jgi:WD40 repeat protein
LTGLTYWAKGLAFSKDGSLLAGSDSKQIMVWDLAAAKPRSAPLPISGATGLAFHPDGSLLVVGWGKGLTLVDVANMRIIGSSQQAPADNLVFNASGTALIGNSAIWQIDPAAWQSRLCRQAGRDLTPAEWSTYLPGQPFQVTCSP